MNEQINQLALSRFWRETRGVIARLTTRSLNVTWSVSGVARFRSMSSTVNCPLMLLGPTTTVRGSDGGDVEVLPPVSLQ